jgi:hypothetical protein
VVIIPIQLSQVIYVTSFILQIKLMVLLERISELSTDQHGPDISSHALMFDTAFRYATEVFGEMLQERIAADV